MNELRVVPKKNYFILGIIIVVTLLVLYYFYMWVDAYNVSKLNISILDKYMDKINYNELDNFLVENPDSIIYVSVLENEDIRTFEKKFRGLFKNQKLDYDLLYMDITEDIKDSSIVKEMNLNYSINSLVVSDVPVIMVFQNGILNYIYNVNVNDYDIDEIMNFINNITFEDGDIK